MRRSSVWNCSRLRRVKSSHCKIDLPTGSSDSENDDAGKDSTFDVKGRRRTYTPSYVKSTSSDYPTLLPGADVLDSNPIKRTSVLSQQPLLSRDLNLRLRKVPSWRAFHDLTQLRTKNIRSELSTGTAMKYIDSMEEAVELQWALFFTSALCFFGMSVVFIYYIYA